MADAGLLPQPDFDVISQHHQGLSEEFRKIQNIPAIDEGNAILTAIERIGAKLNGIETRMKASDVNNVARLVNSQLIHPDSELSILNNLETNLPIEGFPPTPRDVRNMTGGMINAVLRALGMEVGGSIELRRQRLRVQIGLKADSV